MMSYQQRPRLGATFTPGGSDDFYLPEVISPAPQRLVDPLPFLEAHSHACHLTSCPINMADTL